MDYEIFEEGYNAFMSGNFDTCEEAFMVIFDVSHNDDEMWQFYTPFAQGWNLAMDELVEDCHEFYVIDDYSDDAEAWESAYGSEDSY